MGMAEFIRAIGPLNLTTANVPSGVQHTIVISGRFRAA